MLSYIHFGFVIVLPVVVASYMLMMVLKSEEAKRYLYNGLMIIYVLLLSYLIWFQGLGDVRDQLAINLEPFETIKLYIRAYQANTLSLSIIAVNLLGNVVLMFPIGFWLHYKRYGIVRIFLYVVLIPVLFEGGQFLLHQFHVVSRSVDIDDWILNAVGILLGYIISAIHAKVTQKNK
ncbi:VanZ family protein [Amphibacillus sp. Q70]|uniref:VanZ family protein n=1 Tax=Amphibacillus sp. Q70 TaxID=3453416 RepID=UPI003F85A01A